MTKDVELTTLIDARIAAATAVLTASIGPLIQQMITAAMQQNSEQGPDVYTLTEFCARNHMGKSKWHELVKAGHAPEYMRYGNQFRITKEAEAAWRAKMKERATSAEARLEHERRKVAGRKAGAAAGQSPNHVSRRAKKKGK